MSIFQPSVLKSHIALLDHKAVDKAYKQFANYFLDLKIQENIKVAKEEQYQATFLTELFVKIFGYTLFPDKNHNLVTEQKNEGNSRKADGAILKGDAVTAVIELKGTKTKDLESIRKQAFDYKNFNTGCNYVITSNFEKLRFYIDDASNFEEFDLFSLSRKRFELLYLCINKEQLLQHTPKSIKEESLVEEEKITKSFYKDYSLFKRELWKDLAKNNVKSLKQLAAQHRSVEKELADGPATEADDELNRLEKNVKRTLFKKSQKLIDRFLFIFFAEDRGLLQPNYTLKSIEEWETVRKLGVEETLYDRFKKHFNYLDQGRKKGDGVSEIFAYNGGLFKPDSILDHIVISDELLLKHTKKIAAYDFESQVDVNILGHIFENSLNEIESVNAEIDGADFDKQTSKRKKDGVFYTPKYITKYIVDNTVGKLCEEKKTELGFAESEYYRGRKNRNKSTLENLVKILDDYREWLLQLTICDPACGSGAFLNQALDFLITEHNYIDELKSKLLGGSIALSDIENTILENNIYGVDLNEESVEIAKLSLWLRTAQPRRKLNDLSSNIKCGNSLIDVKAVAGDKAFKWEEEFPQVFAKGGFDVVIGNPPYVRQELLPKPHKEFYQKTYSDVYNGAADLYLYFYDLSINILKEKGVLGFITPNKWMERKYGNGLRRLVSKYLILNIVNLSRLKVFEDAIADPSIITIQNQKDLNDTEFKYSSPITENQLSSIKLTKFLKSELDIDVWRFTVPEITNILNKFRDSNSTLKEYTKGGVYYGVKSGLTNVFIIDTYKKDFLINTDPKSSDLINPMVEGSDFKKWHLRHSGKYMISTFPAMKVQIENYPAVQNYMKGFLPKLNQTGESFINSEGKKEKSRKKSSNKWFETQDVIDYYEELLKPKLIYYHTAVNHNFYFDEEGYYISANCYFISNATRYLQCLLNSELFRFVKGYLFPHFGDIENSRGVRLDGNKMNKLPIKIIDSNLEKIFKKKAENLSVNSSYFENLRLMFIDYLNSQFQLEKLSKKLQNWHELDFGDFIKELNKAIKAENRRRKKEAANEDYQEIPTLTKKDEFEWMELFEEKKKEVQELQSQINQTEKEIDQMVYELYGLTDEEIEIVENS